MMGKKLSGSEWKVLMIGISDQDAPDQEVFNG